MVAKSTNTTTNESQKFVNDANGNVAVNSTLGDVTKTGGALDIYLKGGADFRFEVSRGNVAGLSIIHKFGRNTQVGTSIAPVCNGGFYRTPTGTTTLEVISSSADDSASGTGLQEVTLEYLDTNFDLQAGTIETNGLTASTQTISGIKRLVRAYGSRSGTYATSSSASQHGTITVRESGGGNAWGTLTEVVSGFGAGQSLIGAYTVPRGHTAYILSQTVSIEFNKTVDLYFFKRENANDITPPYSGIMRVQNIFIGKSGLIELEHFTYESFPEYTDIGFMANVASGTADVSVEFEMLLADNTIWSV